MKYLWCLIWACLSMHSAWAICEYEEQQVKKLAGELGMHVARGAETTFIEVIESQLEEAKKELKTCQNREISQVQNHLDKQNLLRSLQIIRQEKCQEYKESVIAETAAKLRTWVQAYRDEGYPTENNPDFDREYEEYKKEVTQDMNYKLEHAETSATVECSIM